MSKNETQTGVVGPGAATKLEAALAQPVRTHPDDTGMATAEYAIATLAACGFAGLLVTILRGEQVRGLLMGIVERALSVG